MMDKLFIIQLVTSFIVGGAIIALISIIAERASEKIAGIIISLPSTVAISMFFIGWTLSPEKVAEIAPMLPAAIGVVMIYAITYLYLSKIKLSKWKSISLSVIGSLTVWFVLAAPLAIFEFNDLFLSILIYLVVAAIAYYFLTIKPGVALEQKLLKYSMKEKLFRAIFSGSIITLAVFLSRALGPFWGGIFGMFPAVFLSTMIILHWNYNSEFLFKVWKNSPIGTIIFCVYSLSLIYTFPAFGIFFGTLASYFVSGILFFVTVKLMK